MDVHNYSCSFPGVDVTEDFRTQREFRGTYFGRIPNEIKEELIDDWLKISNALAVPLANLFAFPRPPAHLR